MAPSAGLIRLATRGLWQRGGLGAGHRAGHSTHFRSAASASQSRDGERQGWFAGKGKKLSVEEALYLAKEAGYWTTREVQLQIVRSPPFSPGDRPFLLENFFEVADDEEDVHLAEDEEDNDVEEDEEQTKDVSDRVHPVIHGTIGKHFRPEQPTKFLHNGEEWLSEAEGIGTRRRATAHAVIKRGTGLFQGEW